jgi:hypothetical protein
MEVPIIAIMLGVGVFALWVFLRLQHAREDLGREKRIAELDRLAAQEGRLRKEGDAS